MEPIREMRQQIDDLDRELLRIVAQRMAVVRQIGVTKGDRPVLDPQRERTMTEQWESNAEHEGVAAVLATRLLREVLSHSRRLQEVDRDAPPSYRKWARRIGYQGTTGAYSELAIRHRLGEVEAIGYRTFQALTDAVERGEIDAAMLPIENTIIGSIAETTAVLLERPVTVLDEELWRVRHCLAALPGATIDLLRRVRSHPVALHQCRSHLAALGIEPELFFDTAGAAESVAATGDLSIGALCSAEAAAHNGLAVLARDLEDDAQNFTRFVLVARVDDPRVMTPGPRPMFAKTSVILTTANRPGALARCLQTFASAGINLTRIESRPRPPWESLFIIDFEGHRDDSRVVSALTDIRRECEEVQILGSYPNRTSSPDDLVVQVTRENPEPAAPNARRETEGAPLVSRAETRTIVDVGGVAIGGSRFVLIAGPCAVESREQMRDAARMVAKSGGRILRGGAFKPRTSPYSFQGLGTEGVEFLQAAGREFLLPTVTEVLDVRHVDAVAKSADMIQVGARNMQNFELLKELGRLGKPVLLKRGMSATIEELLQAAEYILLGGNSQVVLCERGIRTFERSTRNTLDLAAVPVLKQRTHLPVIVDPSHAAGRRDLVIPLALAATAAGADALIVEAHPRPDEALSDKEQTLGPTELEDLVAQLRPLLHVQHRDF